MPPKLLKHYAAFRDTYRDRARYGGIVYLARLTDGSTALDADGEPLKFSHDECRDLEGGKSFADVIAARPGVYPAAKVEPVAPTRKPRKAK